MVMLLPVLSAACFSQMRLPTLPGPVDVPWIVHGFGE